MPLLSGNITIWNVTQHKRRGNKKTCRPNPCVEKNLTPVKSPIVTSETFLKKPEILLAELNHTNYKILIRKWR
jgi:hypothetical protein